MLEDQRIKIPKIDGKKRSAASIKYLFTELVCSITGGPEVMTACSLEETQLLLSTEEFFYFTIAIDDAADHISIPKVKCDLTECIFNHMDLMVDPKRCVAWDSICEGSADPKV